jgi:hypothetical protein
MDESSGRQTATASWPESWASEISSSERRMAPLICCQETPVLQEVSRSQALWSPLHSVIATGPSIASMIEAALIRAAGRARV